MVGSIELIMIEHDIVVIFRVVTVWLSASSARQKALQEPRSYADMRLDVLEITVVNIVVQDNRHRRRTKVGRASIAYQKDNPASQSWLAAAKTPSNRKRTALAISVAIIGNLSGSTIAS